MDYDKFMGWGTCERCGGLTSRLMYHDCEYSLKLRAVMQHRPDLDQEAARKDEAAYRRTAPRGTWR